MNGGINVDPGDIMVSLALLLLQATALGVYLWRRARRRAS